MNDAVSSSVAALARSAWRIEPEPIAPRLLDPKDGNVTLSTLQRAAEI